jgi:hypothetical protein
MSNKQKNIIVSYLIVSGFLMAAPVFAASVGLDNPLGQGTTIPQLIGRVIGYFMGIVGSIALGIMVYGGFLWMTSAGSTKRVEAGKNAMIWAVIGLVVIFFSYTAVNFVINGLKSGQTPTGASQNTENTAGGESGCCRQQNQNGISCFGATQSQCSGGTFFPTACSTLSECSIYGKCELGTQCTIMQSQQACAQTGGVFTPGQPCQ